MRSVESALYASPEQRLAALDALPRRLQLLALTQVFAHASERLAPLAAALAALTRGNAPEARCFAWLGEALAASTAEVLAACDVARHCRDDAELATTLLQSLLFHLDFVPGYLDRGASFDEAAVRALAAFRDDWSERSGDFDKLLDVFGVLPDAVRNERHDRLHGLLRSDGWQQALAARRLLDERPELATLLRRLGRAERSTASASASAASGVQITQPTPMPNPVPEVAPSGTVNDIARGGQLERVIAAEFLHLRHRRLRALWHARRAERSLLCYDDRDALLRQRHDGVRMQPATESVVRSPRAERGPMLLAVDTSGSMSGAAEALAKALVLEAMRIAHAERRDCHVLAFGGADEVLQHTLCLDLAGLEAAVAFLGMGFHGGTDVCGPLAAAAERVQTERWQNADLLIASDGAFGATPAVVAQLNAAKREQGLFVQGVLIGDRETIGLLEVADAVYWIRDWRRAGSTAAVAGDLPADFSPVHNKSLTALYFPGALRRTPT